MREAPEALDDVTVRAGVGKVAFEGLTQRLRHRVTQGLEQLHAACLQGAVLGMFERQIEEGPLDRPQLPVQAAFDAVHRPGARQRVGGERGGRIAVDVATELVHQDDPRQHTLRHVLPFAQAALACRLDGGAEAVSLMGRFLGMIPELDTQAPLLGTNLGTGGGWALPMTCYWVSKSRGHLGPDAPVVGMNGVRSGKDVLRLMLAGAHAVEISSAVWTNGFSVLAEAVKTVDTYLRDRGDTATDIIGRAADQVLPFSTLPQRPGFWEEFAPPGAV